MLAAEANDRLASPLRRVVTLLAGLLAVALVLLLALRSARRALMPLIPIALATGWSALVLFLSRIPLNPMSIVLGALVIAIATEFSVLLSERYRRERARRARRRRGAAPHLRVDRARPCWPRASTAIAGFAVLVVSDIKMLRDFGFVTVIDLTVALRRRPVVLPAVLVLAERGAFARLPALRRARRGPRSSGRRRRERRAADRSASARTRPTSRAAADAAQASSEPDARRLPGRASGDREAWLPGAPAGEPAARRALAPARDRPDGRRLPAAGRRRRSTRCAPRAARRPGRRRATQLPPFAAPLVLSDVEGDVNLARER